MQRDHPALLEHDGEPGADEEGGDVVIVTPEGFDALFKRAAGVRGYPEAGIAVLVDGRNANLIGWYLRKSQHRLQSELESSSLAVSFRMGAYSGRK